MDTRPPLESEADDAFVIVARPEPPPAPRIDETEAAPSPQRESRATRRRPGGAKTRRRGTLAPKLARIAAAVTLCAAVPALLGFREKVVALVPGTASLYRVVGMPVNLVGLSFAQVQSTLSYDGGAAVLEVTGEIVNDGRHPRTVPWLQVSLEGEKGEALYSWSTKAAEGELGVGQRAPFRIRLTAPPPAARHVEVGFRLPGERLAGR